MLDLSAAEAIVDVKDAAEYAGLTYVSDEKPGIRRKRSGKGFRYETVQGGKPDAPALKRIKALAIPPAWTDVWICPKANGHIQATGRDARGRKQYRYHARFREVRESTKYHHMLAFADSLPAIRAKVQEHLSLRGLTAREGAGNGRAPSGGHADPGRQRRIRPDQQELWSDHAQEPPRRGGRLGAQVQLQGQERQGLEAQCARPAHRQGDPRLPGPAGSGAVPVSSTRRERRRDVTSSDVNAYLREISGEDITAKDFRTWHGTVLAAMALQEFEKFDSQAGAKRNIRDAIQKVAARLGNTPTICRKCYIHPEIITTYIEGSLLLEVKDKVEAELRDDLASLKPEEAAVLTLLRNRLNLTLKDKLETSLKAV